MSVNRFDFSKFSYTKPGGTKRKQTSTSSTSDSGASPESAVKGRQEGKGKRGGKQGEKKKPKQSSECEVEVMGHPISLEDLHAQLDKLATKDDIQKINENLNKVNDTLVKRVDILEGRLFEMEEERSKLAGELKRMKEENATLRGQVEQSRKEVSGLRTAHNDLEQHGRSWNVRVYGIREEKAGEETTQKCIQKCLKVFSEQVGVSVTERDVEVAHRSGKPGGPRPRPILLRFLSRRKRGEVLADRRKLKNSGVSVGEDLTSANYSLLQRASKHSATLAAWSSNGKVIVKLKNNKTFQLTIDCDVDGTLSKAMI